MDNTPSFKRVLSLRDVTLFGLSFMAPITVFATYGIAVTGSGGMISTGYIITLFCVLFSAISYARLAKQFPSSGSSFIYIKNILGAKTGFIVGWAILLDYILSPMISALIFGIFMNAYFPAVPDYVFIIGFLITVTTINILGIKLAANYNTFITIFQVLFIILFCLFSSNTLIERDGLSALISKVPFYDNNVSWDALLSCIPILYFSFLGFDAITTLAEETQNPEKVVPKAIFSIVITGGFLFVISSYFMQLIVPDSGTLTDPDTAAMQIMVQAGKSVLESIFVLLMVMATSASAIASGSSAARILHAMGKTQVIPTTCFGYLSERFRTPVFNIVLIGIIGLSALVMDLTFATHLISFGVLFSFILINVAVFVHFFIKQKQRLWIKNAILPCAGVIISLIILLALGKEALILGVVWLAIGSVYLAVRPNSSAFKPIEPINEL